MIIHQSIYGEVENAWSLIRTSQKDNSIAKSVALKTDLQEQTIGITWKPALRGFRFGGHFLIMKTFEDTTKGVRRGRKFSHVLMVKFSDIVRINNLIPLFSLLPDLLDKNIAVEEINIEVENIGNLLLPALEGRISKMVNGYIHHSEFKNKLLWFGQDYFDIAVNELWKLLTPAERESFQFGITFNNDYKESEGINLSAVPESVANKFVKSDYFIIRKNDIHTSESLLEKFLRNDQETLDRIDYFESTLNCKTLLRSDIGAVEKCLDTFENIATATDLKKLNTLSHLVAKYSPEAITGEKFKDKLLKRIILNLEDTDYRFLLIFRMFKVESFKNSQQKLTDILGTYINKNILSVKSLPENTFLFFENLKEGSQHWWDIKIVQELKNFLSRIDLKRAKIVYKLVDNDPAVLRKIDGFVDRSHEAEDCFISCIPQKISDTLWRELADFCKLRDWIKLYAHLLVKKYPIDESLNQLLKIDTEENFFSGLDIIINKKNKKSIIDYTVVNGDIRLIKICGELCHEKPDLLNEIDPLNQNWQLVWYESIKCGNNLIDGIKNPTKEIFAILDGLIAGKTIPDFILEEISQSEFGNLIAYPNFSKIWNFVNGDVKARFLSKTSTALLAEFSRNSSFIIPPDPVIEKHISGKGLTDYLYFNRENIKAIIPVFKHFKHLNDQNLEYYLNYYNKEIDSLTAKKLGQLIYIRKFYSSADVIYKKSRKDNNWKFALAECYHLFNFFTRGLLSFTGLIDKVKIPTAEWWDAAQEIITELYSNGNNLKTVWKNAGGKESDLLISGSSADVWNDALYKLRYGKIKGITMNGLLKEIKKQYGNNKDFDLIFKLRSSYIKTK